MTEIHRVELPPLLAQSEHVARLGAGRTRSEHVDRGEHAERLAELSQKRTEEVQAASVVGDVTRQREREREREQARRHPRPQDEPPADDEPGHHVDVTA